MPVKELKGFKRVSVGKGNEQLVTIKVPVKELQKWDLQKHGWKLYPGDYKVILGSNSADEKLSASFRITGK
jgi:beta-glucosidase